MSFKVDWERNRCPSCGAHMRKCCDSVLGEAHQSKCVWARAYDGDQIPSSMKDRVLNKLGKTLRKAA